MLARVVGKHCETGDVVVKDAWLPADVAPGDLLAVAATGAYCRAMASNYNLRRPRRRWSPSGRGRPRVLLRRETDRRPARARPRRLTRGRAVGLLAVGSPAQADARRSRSWARSRSGSPCWAAGSSGPRSSGCSRAQADDLAARIGAPIELVGIGVRDLARDRGPFVPRELLTDDPAALVGRQDVDVVVEMIGGIEPARTLLLQALRRGASVVTANKALLAEDGAGAVRGRRRRRRRPLLRGRVAGAIPLLRPLRESLAGDNVNRVLGIVNGTTNYILDQDGRDGRDLRRRAGRGAGARLRRGRPDRRRRRLRRRREGRDPGRPGLPHPGHDRPTSTARASPACSARRRRDRARDGPRRQAARDLRAVPGRPRRLRARAPGDDAARRTRWPACARPTTRCSSSPRRRAS